RELNRPETARPIAATFADDAFVARLPQGTIELVAVGTCTNGADAWWKPNGEPANRLPYDHSFDSGAGSVDDKSMCRQVVFKTSEMPPGTSPLCLSECVPSQGWSF